MVDLDALAPEFRKRLQVLLTDLQAKGLPFVLFCGRRTFKEQAALFSKGRELRDGISVITDQKAVVTYAHAGESAHNWGLAADFVLDPKSEYWKGKTVTPWQYDDTTKVVWKDFATCVLNAGLEWGGAWEKFKDIPHVQFSNWQKLRPHNWHQIVVDSLMKE